MGLVNELFIAGHETTPARTLGWDGAVPPGAGLPRQVLAELVAELGKLDGQAPTVAQLDSLPLLVAVVKESRCGCSRPHRFFFPPQPGERFIELSRLPLSASGRRLARHQSGSSPTTCRRSSPIRTKFQPERWSRIKPSPYEYLPFRRRGPRTFRSGSALRFATVSLRGDAGDDRAALPPARVAAGADVSYQARGDDPGGQERHSRAHRGAAT